MTAFTVMSLDVWGNQRDGYEVNDQYDAGTIEVQEPWDQEDIFRVLKAEGYFKRRIQRRSVEIEVQDDDVVLVNDRQGRPVYTVWRKP